MALHRICPDPTPWHAVFERLQRHAKANECHPPEPPTPLILAGWAFSNDVEKRTRWEETVAWAERNGCQELIRQMPDTDFHFVAHEPTSYSIGPAGGPMYEKWDYKVKTAPELAELERLLGLLRSSWRDVAGPELSVSTFPQSFAGRKGRRLLVQALRSAHPPWGEWSKLSTIEVERRTFTGLRSRVNRAIAPHKVDHIDFLVVESVDHLLVAEPAEPRRPRNPQLSKRSQEN